MLVCNVSLRPPRSAIAADIAEITVAVDALATGNVVFATLVDDPASVGDIVDAYLGEIMLEAASANAAVDGAISYSYGVGIDEAMTALDVLDGSIGMLATTTLDGTPSAGIVMSNGNLTAVHGTSNNNVGVDSTAYLSAGKFYFECKAEVNIQDNQSFGVKLLGKAYFEIQAGAYGAHLFIGSGTNVYSDGVNRSISFGAATVGDIYSMAVDLTARLAWFRKNGGNWNNSGTANPATGAGGVVLATAAGQYAPYVRFTSSLSSDHRYTVNFGQTSYAYAAPSGFTNWG
jgi:hypothetical protein